MRKITLTMVGMFLSAGLLMAQTKWTVDPMHSGVHFTVTHMVITEVDGAFKVYNGTMVSNKPDFSDATVNFTVDAKSVNTENDMRDGHLKSPDFFDVAKYPQMTFQSTSFKKVSDKNYVLEGNLTIKNITKKVTFNVTYGGTAKDGYGNTKAGFTATGSLNRLDYGLQWNKMTEAGGAVVSNEVKMKVNLELAMAK